MELHFLLLLVFSLLFLSLALLLFKPRLLCDCEICRAYMTSSWSENYLNLCDWYSDLLRRSPTKTIHIHVLGNTVTANPDNVEYILNTNFDNFPKGKNFSAILADFLGRGIFNVDGDLWRFQKKMALLELAHHSVRSYGFEIVCHEIRSRLVPLLQSVAGKGDGGGLDLQDVFRRFAFDCICKFSFGLDPMCLELSLPMSDFAVAFDAASKLSAERAMAVPPVLWKIKRILNLGTTYPNFSYRFNYA